MTGVEYFAVVDPSDAGRMTYWRRTDRGIAPWPVRARYGPRLTRTDLPADLRHTARHARRLQEYVRDWHRQHTVPWHQAVCDAIDADPQGCAARFAAFTIRCCYCGRKLTDPASKTYGIGPDCRDGELPEVLTAFTEAVGRAHAAAGAPDHRPAEDGPTQPRRAP